MCPLWSLLSQTVGVAAYGWGLAPEVGSNVVNSSSLRCSLPPFASLALSIPFSPDHSLTREVLSPFHRCNQQVLGRLNISLRVMQSGSGHTRTGLVSCADPTLCPHHPLLPGSVRALHQHPLRPMRGAREGVCREASTQACSLARRPTPT